MPEITLGTNEDEQGRSRTIQDDLNSTASSIVFDRLRSSCKSMSEITQRLTTALADRYRIESHLGEGGETAAYFA